MRVFRQLSFSLLILFSHAVSAEVISVENPNKGLLNSEPTLTFYMQGQKSKALILLLPGGVGMLHLKPEMTKLKAGVSPILERLTDPSRTSGQYDVVTMDSPYSLKILRGGASGARGSSDHMARIESVIKYYKDKTKLPVVLMGHSNGTISAAEFVRYIQEKNKSDLLNGLILSSTRKEVTISPPIQMPVFFIHHEQDGCENTAYSTDQDRYEKLSSFNKSSTLFITIKTGTSSSTGTGEYGNPCESGFHMFFNADDEVSRKLDEGLSRILFPSH